MDEEVVTVTAPLLAWRTDIHGDACYLMITGPRAEAISAHELVRRLETGRRRGFGSVKVNARIGDSRWATSLFPPREGGWFLPVKKAICRAENLAVDEAVTVRSNCYSSRMDAGGQARHDRAIFACSYRVIDQDEANRACLACHLSTGVAQAAQTAPEADFDLRHVDPDMEVADTIIVTGRRRASQRLQPLPDLTDPLLPRAQLRLFGDARLGPDVGPDAGGTPSIMMRLKIPF